MFKLVRDPSAPEAGINPTIEIELDGNTVTVPAGVTVAAAMLILDAVPFRTSPVDGSLRAPYCLMGVCAECLVSIDDQPGQYACQRVVQAGMRVERQLKCKPVDE